MNRYKASDTKSTLEDIKYELVVETAREFIFICDTYLRIIYLNQAAITSSGYDLNEISGTYIDNLFDESYVLKLKKHIESHFGNPDSVALCQALFLPKDDRPIQVEVSFEPILVDHAIQGYLLIARDISKKKCVEEDALKAQKLESIGVLAGGIAHDYNNLLTAIMGYMTLAESFLEPDNKALSLLGRARHAVVMAKNLSRKLITFSKGGKPTRSPGAIQPVLEDTISLTLSGSNVSCEFQIPQETWAVEFDETQIAHAIQNIALNARESMPHGGSLGVQVENLCICEDNGHPIDHGNWVRISLRDRGSGIPKENIGKIFDPYFTTKEMGARKGLGLGLSIAHSIISKHKGHITVESELNQGSVFHIYLPALNAPPMISKKFEKSQSEQRTRPRLLVMDDEEVARHTPK